MVNLNLILSIFATAFAFIAVYLIAVPKRKGYFFAIGSHICWIIYSFLTNQLMVGLQSFVLMFIAIKGLDNWKNKNIG